MHRLKDTEAVAFAQLVVVVRLVGSLQLFAQLVLSYQRLVGAVVVSALVLPLHEAAQVLQRRVQVELDVLVVSQAFLDHVDHQLVLAVYNRVRCFDDPRCTVQPEALLLKQQRTFEQQLPEQTAADLVGFLPDRQDVISPHVMPTHHDANQLTRVEAV